MVKLSCAIVGVAESVFSVLVDDDKNVSELKYEVKQESSKMITCDAKDLQLFLAKEGNGAWMDRASVAAVTLDEAGRVPVMLDEHGSRHQFVKMVPSLCINNDQHFGKNFQPVEGQVHLLLVVPKIKAKRPAQDEIGGDVLKRMRIAESVLAIITPKTMTDFKNLSISEDEFRLDSLFTTQQSASPIVMTPGLHEFWEGFGEFPQHYFVRMEEVVFWKVIKKLLFDKDRVVIVGSSGVGKSCFLMLIAFCLACTEKKKVLVIRCLKQRKYKNAVVFFDGQGSYARLRNLSSNDIVAIRGQARGAIVLVDGFTQAEVEDTKNEYEPFDFLATSCQFDAKPDDNSHIVVLPAWRDADLLQYAKLTNWVVETGLRKTEGMKESTWPKLVKEQYFYSGGSLREFCRERKMLEMRVVRDCRSVDATQSFDLVYNYGGGQVRSQVDPLRRHYITDCHKEEHYVDSRWWKLSVDSVYALSELGRIADMDKLLEIYKYAKSVGASLHGVAYRLLFHNAVSGAYAKRKLIVLKMQEGSRYEKIEIHVPKVVRRGEDEASCYACLSTLGKDTYWYPNNPFFPFVDAVTTCNAFYSGGEVFASIVAYIQVTNRSEKKFKGERLHRLNEEMDKNKSLKDMKRVFVVVCPDSDVCERFNLLNAPDPNTFLTMVSCFNPEPLGSEVN